MRRLFFIAYLAIGAVLAPLAEAMDPEPEPGMCAWAVAVLLCPLVLMIAVTKTTWNRIFRR